MKAPKKKQAETPKHPAPAWMDEDLRKDVEHMNPGERQAMAEKLEEKAAQLRDFRQKVPPPEVLATVALRPNIKRAVLAYYDYHGNKNEPNEANKLSNGIRWILEIALPMIEKISNESLLITRYRTREGIEDCVYAERRIGEAVDQWLKKINESES